MTEQKKPPVRAKRRSALYRRRLSVFIGLGVVVLLAVAFLVVWLLTSRTVYKDFDGTKYQIKFKGGVYVLLDEHGNKCSVDEDGNYVTAANTILRVDSASGKYTVIAMVPTEGSEKLEYDYYNGAYKVLIYPKLERSEIASIRVVNDKDSFAFVRDDDDTFILEGYPGIAYNSGMFATLVTLTGYTSTLARLDLSNPDVAYGFAANGYAEYGLPDNPEDGKKYFIITAKDGTTHKVLIGNEITSGAGYYVRYVGRDSVYVMKEIEASENNSTFAATLLGTMEDFVTPLGVVPMNATSYFDVTNFTLSRVPEDFVSSGGRLDQIIKFSYEPIETRRGTFYANIPYVAQGDLSGYAVNSYHADDCLQNLQLMSPLRTVQINRPDVPLDEATFAEKYGVAYVLEFTYNESRNSSQNVTSKYDQIVWISPMTEYGTYYLFAEIYDMVVEVSRSDLEFLEWSSFEWISADIFSGNIGFCEEITISGKTGTAEGLTDVTFARFLLDNSASSKEESSNGMIDTSKLRVIAEYLRGSENARVELTDTTPFRQFYQTLIYSSLSGYAQALSEEQMNAYRESGDDGADIIITMRFNADGKTITRTYRFYHYANRQSFMTLNGKGEFYMERARTTKIFNDLGRVLLNDPSVTIYPQNKT